MEPPIRTADPEKRNPTGQKVHRLPTTRWHSVPSKSINYSVSSDDHNCSTTRSTPIIVVVAVVSVISVLAIGITAALVMMDQNNNTSTIDNRDAYTMSITLSTPFNSKLLNPLTEEFHLLAEIICDEIAAVYRQSEVRKGYYGCVVNNFNPGSTVVNFTVIFISDAQIKNRNPPASSPLTPMEYTLMMIVEDKGTVMINRFRIGSTSISTSSDADMASILEMVNAMDDDDNCVSAPCLNGAICSDGLDTFFCTCVAGYTGKSCGIDIEDCSSNTCAPTGTCQDQVDGFICLCEAGYDGTLCNNNIDDCSPNPCVHGTCSDGVDTFSCSCDAGYEGRLCGIDTDECSSSPCASTGTCQDQVDGFTCLCEAGWNGTLCNNNIDDCSPNPCVHGICSDGVDTFSCSCDAGYEGRLCAIDTDECSSSPCASTGMCQDQVDGFICLCEAGYDGTLCNNNIDDCSPNPCVHGNCSDEVAGFSCTCDTGYEGDTCGIDTDECSSSPCTSTGTCQDQVNGFICLCEAGYNGTLCNSNIDDCSPNPCVHGTCSDGVDGFSCTCDSGFEGDTCGKDIAECGTSTCSGNGQCVEVVGGGTLCQCFAGWSGTDCRTDINYCDSSPCENGGTCFERQAGFSCECIPPWTGYTCGIGLTITNSSAQYAAYSPEYIIDGNADNADNAESFCSQSQYSFVTIDLGDQYTVDYLTLWARQTMNFDQVDDMDFRVAPTEAELDDASSVCRVRIGAPTTRPEYIICTTPLTGRYVRAGRFASTGFLCFVELEISYY